MTSPVDPFIGTEATALPPQQGLAATWWWPKPQVGNTHPGATYPLGMVSACAYSGAYPTGYGRYGLSTEGVPEQIHDRTVASGFTHFQQSGTGAIRKYYNYFRVTPMLQPLDDLGELWDVVDEQAAPGYYAATLENGIRAEITVGPKSAVHRYTFPSHRDARLVIDFSLGGLAIPFGRTVPLRAHLQSVGPGQAQGEIVVEGAPWPCTWSAPTRGGGSCSGTTGDSCRAAPAWTSTASAPRPCARSGSCGPGPPNRGGRRAAVRLLVAGSRAGPGEPRTRVRSRADELRPAPRRDGRRVGPPHRGDRGRHPRR
ncbi:hypothetical protein [Cellulomonas soli]